MSLTITEIVIAIVTVTIGIYYYLISNYNYWKLKGVPGPKPSPPFGNIKDIIKGKCSWAKFLRNTYDSYRDDQIVGIYFRREPILLVQDIELIKTVLIRDFSNFVDRGIKLDYHNPLSAHLFTLEPKIWRPLRMKLSPVFTSGKLKDMFYLLNECADHLDKYLNDADGKCIDMRDIAAKFTTDVIGLCAFGIEANALEEENSIFRQMGKRVFDINWKVLMRIRLMEFFPPLYKLIGGLFADRVLVDFFINLTRSTIEYREKNNITRHDFVDLLRMLKSEPSKIDDIKLTDELMSAQLFVFFIAGFETSSSTISNCLFELAMNHKIQDKLREEIKCEVEKTNGKITYEGIKKMNYLDKIVKETLRKYPPLTMLMRKSAASYTFPNTNVTIPADMKIMIPIYGIQYDSRLFPNPDTFDPEHFSDEAVKNRSPLSFLAFGDGPRNCIGARFGSVQTKVGLVKIIQNYKVDVCDKTDREYKINARAFLLTPQNGIVLKITKC